MKVSSEMWTDIKEILASYGLTGILGLILLWHIVTAAYKPENLKIVYGWVWYFLSIPFKIFRKRAIRFRVEGPCTKALKKISNELPEIDIPDLKISWVNEDNLKTKLTSGKAIVKLKFDNDNTKNIIKTTSIYVQDAFLSHAKSHLSVNFRKAIDLSVTKKILLSVSSKENNRHIITQFTDENLDQEPEVFEKCEKVEELDDNGLFTRILLRELDSFGHKLFGRTIKSEYSKEADDFLHFVYKIATRDYDDFTPLAFPNTIIKIGVVLVAKPETYYQYGVEPYLRRIKLGLTQGIKTFYLLARSEKVDILKKVAKDLLHSGNFIQINKAKEYKDREGRTVLCYCLQVNEDSLLANSLKEIGDAIASNSTVQTVVTRVRENTLELDVNGIVGSISKQNTSVLELDDARLYFTENSTLEALPLEIKSDGVVEFSLKNTNSDPNYILTSQFTVDKVINGTVTYIDDTFIKFDVGHEKVEGIAFREDLTPSRFIFLHEKFHKDQELELRIKGYNYERANIILKLAESIDVWPPKNIRKGSRTELTVCKKTTRSLVGELSEGVEGVIPYWALGYFENEIESAKKDISLNSVIDCVVTEIDLKEKVVFLSCRNLISNPYHDFFKTNKNGVFEFIIDDINPYGVLGHLYSTDKPFDIYIPKYEMSWNGKDYDYKAGTKKKVSIKDVDRKGDRFIGTFKPIIHHPLSIFQEKFDEGQVLKNLKQTGAHEFGLTFTINLGRNNYEAVLFKGEISNLCFITDCHGLKSLTNIALQIKQIDLEKNRIVLSLKDLTRSNKSRIEDLDYELEYDAIILGDKHQDYIVLIQGLWIEGILETKKQYDIGQSLKVRAALADENKLMLTDE